MVTKKNKKLKRSKSKKKVPVAFRKKTKNAVVSKKATNQKKLDLHISLFIKNIFRFAQKALSKSVFLTTSLLTNLIRAPFLFINVFSSTLFSIFRSITYFTVNIFKNILFSIYKFKEVFFGILFGIISGGIGAILAVSYIELSSDQTKKSIEIYENQKKILSKISIIEERVKDTEKNNIYNKSSIEDIKLSQEKLLKSEEKFDAIEEEINNLSESIKVVEKQTYNIDSDLSILRDDLKSNSRLILSSSKTELSNRLYLAQSLLDRLQSGVPYSPQLKALGKEGLDPALLRFANGGAPTLKDLEARLSARAGEQLDADRTKKDTSWKENLKREISKYVKIKPTNIQEIKGVTGALLRAEQSISRGNLSKAIEEISSVPVKQRGPLDAWLTEAVARQNADIAAKNLLAKTTAALQNKN